jgi:hypothetical protein
VYDELCIVDIYNKTDCFSYEVFAFSEPDLYPLFDYENVIGLLAD